MENFTQCFNSILTGDKEASRKAARQVRKLVYSPGDSDRYKLIASIIKSSPQEYKNITEEFRQENFVTAISVMYFLHDKESQPDFLFPWLFQLLQHKNGNIRQAAVRMLDSEMGPLTVHIRFPNEKISYGRKTTPEQADMILFSLYANLMALENDAWSPAYKKYKYISSLPSCPYKSVQMVLCALEDDCGEQYMARLTDSLHKSKIIEGRSRLIKQVKEGNVLDQAALTLLQSRLRQMRQELETEMLPIMQKFYPNFDFQKVKFQVYEGLLLMPELMALISDSINLNNQSIEKRNAFLDFISTIWNIYPHKELEDYSPYEIVAMHEFLNKRSK